MRPGTHQQRIGRVLLAALCMLALAWAAATAMNVVGDWRAAASDWHLVVNGEDLITPGLLDSAFSGNNLVGIVMGLAAALVATVLVLLVVPMTLLFVLGLLALILLVSVGLPLLAAAAVLAVVLSPLWLLVLLLLWALRAPRRQASIAA